MKLCLSSNARWKVIAQTYRCRRAAAATVPDDAAATAAVATTAPHDAADATGVNDGSGSTQDCSCDVSHMTPEIQSLNTSFKPDFPIGYNMVAVAGSEGLCSECRAVHPALHTIHPMLISSACLAAVFEC